MPAAGYKLFVTGDVLTAAQVNDYLMLQTVMVFANSAARTSALSAVLAEGLVSYLQDTNVVEIYTGAAWVSLDDPNAIQNSIVDAKGDLISATADNTPARLAVGANATVLTADSTTATGLKWAAPAAPSFVGANAFRSSASITLTSNTWTYITFPSELYDTDSFHDTTTNTSRFTVPAGKAGKDLLNFAATFDGVANAYFYLQFFKNGGSALQSGSGVYGQFKDWQANNWSQSISTVTSLSVADYVEGAVLNASTQTDTLYGIFSITYLGA